MKWFSQDKRSPLRRVAMVIVAGIGLGWAITTVCNATSKEIIFEIRITDSELRARRTRVTITQGEHTAIEAITQPRDRRSATIRHLFELRRQPSRVEVAIRGCQSVFRDFDPTEVDRVTIDFVCRQP